MPSVTGDDIRASLTRPKTAIATADRLDDTSCAIPASTATIGLPNPPKSHDPSARGVGLLGKFYGSTPAPAAARSHVCPTYRHSRERVAPRRLPMRWRRPINADPSLPKRVDTDARPSSSSLDAGVVRSRAGSDSSRSALAVANLHS